MMIRKIFIFTIVLLLIAGFAFVPAIAAGNGNGGNGGTGGGNGASDSGGNGGDGGTGGSGGDGSGSESGSSGNEQSGGITIGIGPTGSQAQQGQDGQEVPPRTEEQSREQQENIEQPGIQIHQQDRDEIQGRTRDEFLSRIQEMEMDQEQDQTRDRDQANLSLAVYSFSIAANVTGDAGPRLTQLSAQINQSLENATQAEVRIRERSSFTRMFLGGDSEAAGIILQTSEQNQERLQEMKQLLQDCDCDPLVQAKLQEQIQTLEQERDRLRVLAQQEQNDTGLLGWLFR
ncbi:MAG TPA: hypothetical protein VMW63_00155 [Methanoregulaceae archaeon]|nr:hypothetical protein [Methanoregulaceae archaeon]